MPGIIGRIGNVVHVKNLCVERSEVLDAKLSLQAPLEPKTTFQRQEPPGEGLATKN